jgi:hypothetical protein
LPQRARQGWGNRFMYQPPLNLDRGELDGATRNRIRRR